MVSLSLLVFHYMALMGGERKGNGGRFWSGSPRGRVAASKTTNEDC